MGTTPETNEIQQENSFLSRPNHAQSTFPYQAAHVMKDDHKDQMLENEDDMGTVALVDNNFSGNMEDLDRKVKSMMEKSSNTISYGNGRLGKANVCKIRRTSGCYKRSH